ncbi:MAG: hypothetical protein LBV79_07445 [Candidatus Adiutrix sp.]|jgi:hypothetical protein|nr:hypothetical protein [Candidatus Adiutrix sp.]
MSFKKPLSKLLVFSGAVCLSIVLLGGVCPAQQRPYYDYTALGYTPREVDMLERYSTVLGLALVCGAEAGAEMKSVVDWMRQKEQEGLPDLTRPFFEHMESIIADELRSPGVSCNEVRQTLSVLEFPK